MLKAIRRSAGIALRGGSLVVIIGSRIGVVLGCFFRSDLVCKLFDSRTNRACHLFNSIYDGFGHAISLIPLFHGMPEFDGLLSELERN